MVLLFNQTKAAYKIDALDVRIIYDTNKYDENVYVFQWAVPAEKGKVSSVLVGDLNLIYNCQNYNIVHTGSRNH